MLYKCAIPAWNVQAGIACFLSGNDFTSAVLLDHLKLNRNGGLQQAIAQQLSAKHAVVNMAITSKRLAQAGYFSLSDRYESLHLCD